MIPSEEISKIMEKYPDSSYTKWGVDYKTGETISVRVFANLEAEKKSFEECYGFTLEDVENVKSLTEKQRKLLLLQAQKEKLEQEIASLI